MRVRFRTYYLHTIDEKPAYFDGDQVVFNGGRWARGPQPLATSLRQIKDERLRSILFRLKRGWRSGDGRYGHVRVTVSEPVRKLRRQRPNHLNRSEQ